MTTDTLLRLLRDKIVEIDPATNLYTDEQLMVFISDALRVLQAKKVDGMPGLTVELDADQALFGVNPNTSVTDPVALLLMLKASIDILMNEFRGRIRRGELGTSWSSGLEKESSIDAAKQYRGAIADLEMEYVNILLIQRSPVSGTRIQ